MSTDNKDLPAPLVPAEVDLRSFETMPLAVQMVRDSRFVSEVKPEAFRAGFLLWCASWHQVPAGSVPDNDIELAKLAGYGFAVSAWKKLRREALTKFVRCSDGRLYHEEVSARALVAWNSRLEHFYGRAKERLRKASKDTKPITFEQWNERRLATGAPMEKVDASPDGEPISGGTPQGIPPNSGDGAAGIPPENATKVREQNGEGTFLKEKETPAASRLVDRPADAVADDPTAGLPGIDPPPPKPKPYTVPECPYADIVEAYRQHLPMLPTVTVLNEARREHIRARWREVCAQERFTAAEGLDWFRWYFADVAQSKHLTGRGRARGDGSVWRATFDWLFLPTNFAKVVDGNYRERTPA